jgi:hypothetical protein
VAAEYVGSVGASYRSPVALKSAGRRAFWYELALCNTFLSSRQATFDPYVRLGYREAEGLARSAPSAGTFAARRYVLRNDLSADRCGALFRADS